MTNIDPQEFSVGSFRSLWAAPFSTNKDRCVYLFEKMRFSLAPDLRAQVEEGMTTGDPFTLIWNGFCWENIIIPIFVLNGEKLEGNFKVLTNTKKGYHFVVFDEAAKMIYDPTYEKHPDAQLLEPKNLCRGTDCTKPMLGKRCRYFDLGYYLREYERPDDQSFTSQLREYGGRFLDAVAVEANQEKC